MEELSLLKSYGRREMVPNKRDPFPEIYISLILKVATWRTG